MMFRGMTRRNQGSGLHASKYSKGRDVPSRNVGAVKISKSGHFRSIAAV
jgi:hypothetical protein